MIPLETIDAPDVDCVAGHGAFMSDDDECFALPIYDFWGDFEFCQDPDVCAHPAELLPFLCMEAEEDIPF